jgi:release factor glutamine methyltransferase
VDIANWLIQAENRLAAAGFESPRLQAQVLAAHVLLVDRSWLLSHPEAEFPDLAGEHLLQRRERHEPLAYIVGKREFYGREFVVRPGVLIPRQDTEILVETALEAIDELSREARDSRSYQPDPSTLQTANRKLQTPLLVLDIGVGSGAIAVTLKLERPSVSVTGVDLSAQALQIADENAAALGADLRLLPSDGFEALRQEKFDVIVSNPPYIGQFESLPTEVSEFEPEIALISGPTGIEFYERLATEASAFLVPGGRLILEVGHTQASAVRELFARKGWTWRRTVRDLAGIERVVEFSI